MTNENKIKPSVKDISEKPGCYVFKDSDQEIIYIGKAKNLKKRVNSHFQKNEKKRNFISRVSEIQTFLTTNPKEAFILEQNLIKKHKPRYNVLLKHNNYYPYIILANGDFPKYAMSYRYSRKDGDESFGPFPDGSRARETLSLLEKIFPLSRCDKKSADKSKPCIYYEMGQCAGYCFKQVPKEHFETVKKKVSDFFSGKIREIKSKIKKLIEKNNKSYSFEESKKQKKILDSLDFMTSKQNIETRSSKNKDFWGFFLKDEILSVKVLVYRYGNFSTSYDKVVHLKETFQEKEETIESIIMQFYRSNVCPQEIILSETLQYKKEIEKSLGLKITTSANSNKDREILGIANFNSQEIWNTNFVNNFKGSNKSKILERFGNLVEANKNIYRFEALDISNISLIDAVGCFCLFLNGEYESSKYYELEKGSSDLEYIEKACIKHFSKKSFTKVDMLIIDGGKMQVRTAISALKKLKISLQVIGLVKDLNHKTNAVINSKLEEVNFVDSETKTLMSNVQETVHNKAINFHRKIHARKTLS